MLGEHASSVADKARQDLADHVVEPFRDGIARATGDAPDGQGARGSDLFFLGIGMVVGLLVRGDPVAVAVPRPPALEHAGMRRLLAVTAAVLDGRGGHDGRRAA